MGYKVPTWATYIVAIVLLVACYIWATFFPSAPYTILAGSIVSISGAYWVKRSSDQKQESLNIRVDKEINNGPFRQSEKTG